MESFLESTHVRMKTIQSEKEDNHA